MPQEVTAAYTHKLGSMDWLLGSQIDYIDYSTALYILLLVVVVVRGERVG